MRSEEPSRSFDVQNVENEAEQMGLPQLSRQPRPHQQPIIEFAIEFAIVEDNDGDDDQDEDDGNGEYGFFTGVISNPGDEDDSNCMASDSDDTWSVYSSESGEASWLQKYGGWYLNISSWRYEPIYRFVQPDPRASSNVAAAALQEPISLLTKYRHQRLSHQSTYFHASIPGPSKTLCRARQVRRGSHLKKVRNVDDQIVRWA